MSGNPQRPSSAATGDTAAMDDRGGLAPSVGEAEALPRGTLLGRHVILDRLGAGGMGVVYAAYDPRLDRRVAIKLLRPGRRVDRDPTAGQARLLREAQAMARLSHPNVLAVYDVGTWQDQVFLAMELVEGTTLTHWLNERPRSWREIRDVFLGTGQGLAAAHAAGLVHRDFKPDNVMVSAEGRVRVMDFGLALDQSDTESGSHSVPPSADLPPPSALRSEPLTQASLVLGTPHYMAPEQFEGHFDARADQYSFCVAMYEALFGELPGATGGHEPQRHGRVPVRLRRALLRGLSRNPLERFPSMKELLAELARDPATARTRWIGVGAGVALVAVAGTLFWQARRANGELCTGAERKIARVWSEPQRGAAKAAFLATGKPFAPTAWEATDQMLGAYARDWTAMHTEACEATRLRGEQSDEVLSLRMLCLDQRLEELGALAHLLVSADSGTVEQALRAVVALTPVDDCADIQALTSRVRMPRDPVTRAKIEALRGQLAEVKALMNTSRVARGLELAQKAAAEARELGYKPLEAEIHLALGTLEFYAGHYPQVATSLYEAVWAAEEGGDTQTVAEASTRLVGFLGGTITRPEEAMLWAAHARAALRRLGKSELIEARLIGNLSSVYLTQDKFTEALEEARKALALREKLLGPEHPDTASALAKVGDTLSTLRRNQEAVELLTRALAIYEKVYGPDHPQVARILINLNGPLTALNRMEESLEQQHRALRIYQGIDPETEVVSYAFNNIGVTLKEMGRLDESLQMLERGLALRRKLLPPTHRKVGGSLANIGVTLMLMGRNPEARKAFEECLSIYEKSYGPDHAMVGDVHSDMGEVELESGRPRQARAHFDRALTIAQKTVGPKDGSMAWHLERLSRALLALGQAAEGRKLAQEAFEIAQASDETKPYLSYFQFTLAKALWSQPSQRARARQLLSEAQKHVGATFQEKRLLAEIAAWKKKHREA